MNGGIITKNVTAILLTVLVLFCFTLSIQAETISSVAPDSVLINDGEYHFLKLKITDNQGVMGFKIHFDYSEECVEFASSTRGDITKSGNYNDNIGVNQGQFDILWSNTSDAAEDGTISIIKYKVLSDEPFEVEVSYSQPDTFNEQWEDVVLNCEGVYSENWVHQEVQFGTENDKESKVPETENKSGGLSVGDVDIEYIVSDTLNKYDSSGQLTDKEKDEIVTRVNNHIFELTGESDVYTDFNQMLDDYEKSLKNKFALDVESLDTEDSAKRIIDRYLEDKEKNSLEVSDVSSIMSILESEGLNKKYSDFLTDEELLGLLNQAQKENSQSYNAILIMSVITFCLLISVLILVMYANKRRKNENES